MPNSALRIGGSGTGFDPKLTSSRLEVQKILSNTNDWHQPLLSYWQLGYVLIYRTPPYITG